MRQPRFEICQDFDGFWVRFRAANGRVVWVTETYRRRKAAVAAVELISDGTVRKSPFADHAEVNFGAHLVLEVREIDERDGAAS